MSFPITELKVAEFPKMLLEIPQPPKQLFYRGQLPHPKLKLLAVVGSRKYSTYGQQVIEHLLGGLQNYPVGIVSGLALGVDALAHKEALANNLYTLSVPGSGLDDSVLYPRTNRRLATQILEANGGLLSEFPTDTKAAPWTFPQRNRIMAGLTHATLVIEATAKSGTLITARMATDYNRELLVVPGNIFSQNTTGPHQFLKLGATPVTDATDILYALGIDPEQKPTTPALNLHTDLSPDEILVLETLIEPMEKDALIRLTKLDTTKANTLLMQMQLKGLIKEEFNLYRPSKPFC